MTNPLRRLGRDTLYVLTGFPLAVLAFTVVLSGLATSVGLLITLVGIPLAVLTLLAARGLATVERARQGCDGACRPPRASAAHTSIDSSDTTVTACHQAQERCGPSPASSSRSWARRVRVSLRSSGNCWASRSRSPAPPTSTTTTSPG